MREWILGLLRYLWVMRVFFRKRVVLMVEVLYFYMCLLVVMLMKW